MRLEPPDGAGILGVGLVHLDLGVVGLVGVGRWRRRRGGGGTGE